MSLIEQQVQSVNNIVNNINSQQHIPVGGDTATLSIPSAATTTHESTSITADNNLIILLTMIALFIGMILTMKRSNKPSSEPTLHKVRQHDSNHRDRDPDHNHQPPAVD